MELYSIVSDGAYVYTCVPWDDYHAKWELIYDESGRPAKIHLVDEDITD